jgi:hypothetical protein
MLVDYAKEELRRVGDLEYDGMVAKSALEIVELFASQGHSGGSAQITIALVSRLMQYQPLSPLTGEDDEWTEVASQDDQPLFQNKRCPSVFKNSERAWDIDLPPTENGWQGISFPYTPGEQQDGFERRAAKLGGDDAQ